MNRSSHINNVFSMLIQQERQHTTHLKEDKLIAHLVKPSNRSRPIDYGSKKFLLVVVEALKYASTITNQVIP